MKHFYLIFLVTLGLFSSYGSAAQSGISQVEKENSSNITLYPNPADDFFSIMTSEPNIAFVTIHNIVGKKVKTIKAKADQNYDIQGLRRGIYIVRVYDNNDKMLKALRLSKT